MSENKKTLKQKQKKLVYDILIVFFSLVLVVSGFLLVQNLIPRFQTMGEVSDLQELSPGLDDLEQTLVKFDELKAINSDVKAWITINDTKIDFPVVQTTNNDYYLSRSFKKNSNGAGAIFIDANNSGDFTDQNTIIYGHAMKDRTMFGTLSQYRNQSHYNEHPFITIYREDGTVFYYQIFSVNVVEATYDYRRIDFGGNFNSFISRIQQSSVIKSSAKIDSNSRILTLSTCTSAIDDGRLVIFAVCLNPNGEQINLSDYSI